MSILPLLLSLAISLVAIPVLRRLSRPMGLVAKPRSDRWHHVATPKNGGVAIFLAFGLTMLIQALTGQFETHNWPMLVGATLTFTLGLTDDYWRITPPAKLIGEILAAAIVVFFGRNIDFFNNGTLNILFTFFWLVGITNAINLLDNMDGLAGGVDFIAAGLLSFLFWRRGAFDLMAFSLSLAGAVLGFLIFNFPPAKVFMGDSGSHFLGFSLSSLAIARAPQASNVLAVMGVPMLLFLLPILDTTLVTVTRLLRGQSPAQGGKDHTSHRLIAFGLSERQAVLSLYAVAILSGILAVVIESLDYTLSLVLIPVVLVTLALLMAYLGRMKIVSAQEHSQSQAGLTNLIVNLTYRGRILEIGLDLFLISIAYYLAFWIHYGTQVDILNLDIFLGSLPIALAGSYISFFVFGIYRGLWQFLDIRDLLRYSWASVGSVLLVAGSMTWIYYPLAISFRIFVIFAILLLLGLVITRTSFTILDRIYSQQARASESRSPVLILGADEEGMMLLQWLNQETGTQMNPVGFLDEDPYKLGREILGIQVLGTIEDLDRILQHNRAEGVLLPTRTTLEPGQLTELVKRCEAAGVWCKRTRMTFDLID